MKRLHTRLAIGWSFLWSMSCIASGAQPGAPANLSTMLSGLPSVQVSSFPAMASRYRDTECVELSRVKTAEKLGFVCRTRDRQFVDDMGITLASTLPPSSQPPVAPASGLVVVTPMSTYPMENLTAGDGRIAAATVDCDIEGKEIYRATATCHVAVQDFAGSTTTYSNLLLQVHVGQRMGLTNGQIAEIWSRLRRR